MHTHKFMEIIAKNNKKYFESELLNIQLKENCPVNKNTDYKGNLRCETL